MPPLGEAIDDPTSNDEYVAQLLARDARDRSLKYSALGLEAYLPRRSTGKPPKPNTRFLKNILRDTDSHNASLRRKEEDDARERMRRLHGSSSSRRSDRDRERRDDRAERHHSHRLRDESVASDRTRRRRRHRSDSESESDHHRSRRHRHSRRDERDRSRRRRESSRSPNRSRRDRDRDYSRRHRHRHSRSPSRSRSPRASRHDYRRGSRDRGSCDRERDKDSRDSKHRDTPSTFSRDQRQESRDRSTRTTDHHSSDEDSDPLEDLIGPLPQDAHRQIASVPSRGRGAYRSKESNIDAHFAPDYDPTLDVRLDEEDDAASTRPKRRPVAGLMTEDDDWDMALEALRDRAQWKQKGAERLRAAGFGEQVVEQWTKDPAFTGTSTEGRIEDVRWAKRGEGREWDRGKVMSDGHYDVKAQW